MNVAVADLDPAFASAVARFTGWVKDGPLPLWAERGRDAAGGFYEDMTPDGAPRTDRERRMRVQPRQAYVYAHAGHLGWFDGARAVSDGAFDFLLTRAAVGDPVTGTGFDGFAHRLHADGSVADATRDTYDHAFVLLACAWRIRAFGDTRSEAVARHTLAWLDRKVRCADGSFRESLPDALPRRQNPHMHLFEAFIALGSALDDNAILSRARAILTLFDRHFYDAGAGVIREFFGEDWSLDPARGDEVEPGHMAEWAWLLDQGEEVLGEGRPEAAERLYQRARALGAVRDGRFLVDSVDLSGAVLPRTCRTWVQTEHLKATLVRARKSVSGAQETAAELITALLDAYTSNCALGAYTDRFEADTGMVVSEAVPASTLYHLVSAAAEADATLQVLRESTPKA